MEVKFDFSNDLINHLRSHRESGGDDSCEILGKQFPNMQAHKDSQQSQIVHLRHLWQELILIWSSAETKEIHSKRTPDICSHCGLTFSQSQLLRGHLKTRCWETTDPSKGEDGSKLASPSFCCRVCSESFHSRSFLRKHTEMHSGGSVCVRQSAFVSVRLSALWEDVPREQQFEGSQQESLLERGGDAGTRSLGREGVPSQLSSLQCLFSK